MRICCSSAGLAVVLLALAAPATLAADLPMRLAQATDTTTPTAPSVTPVIPNSTSATCQSGCNTQSTMCQNTCISTINGTTVIPSITSVGVTTSPNQCVANCSSQLQQCQRNCALQ